MHDANGDRNNLTQWKSWPRKFPEVFGHLNLSLLLFEYSKRKISGREINCDVEVVFKVTVHCYPNFILLLGLSIYISSDNIKAITKNIYSSVKKKT